MKTRFKKIRKVKTDLLVLSELRRNARQSITLISRRTGLSVSTIINKIEKLNPFVKKYSALIDFSKIGFNIHILFLIKAEKSLKPLLENPFVNNAYKINDSYNYYIEAVFKSIKDYDDFKKELLNHSSKFKELFVVEEFEREGFLGNGIMV